jgi:hypothetical protein
MSVVTFPNTVTVVLARLKTALPSLVFVHDIPTTRPPTFTRVYRTGGPRTNIVVDGAQLSIESWAATADLAATNAELVRAQLNAFPEQPGTPPIYKIEEMSGPAELPDPVSSSRRFTWTVLVHIRGQ